MDLISPLARAFDQLGDRVFLGVLLRSLLVSALLFLLTAAVALTAVHWALRDFSWMLGWAGGVVALVAAAIAAMLLFVPVAGGIAMLLADRVADAVERQHYPNLPPTRPAALTAQIWDALALGLRLLLLQAFALALTLALPGVGLLLGWLVSAWGMGRGLFMTVALRRMPRAAAKAAYRQRRWSVIGQGGAFVLAGMVPLLNLLAPLLGVAAMVHVLHTPAPDRPPN